MKIALRLDMSDLLVIEKALAMNVRACDDALILFGQKVSFFNQCGDSKMKHQYQMMADDVQIERKAIEQRLNQIRGLIQ